MSIFDQYQKGSFRDVPFLFQGSDADMGRRVAVHEYPGRDLPYVEDMGRLSRTWSLDLIVAGPNYMAARDALIEAIEKPGPGQLIHPTLGALTVAVVNARGPRESTRDGGIAQFQVSFIESGENVYPAARVDTAKQVGEKADAAHEAAQDQLNNTLDVSGPGFLSADAVAQVTGFADTVRRGISKISSVVTDSAIYQGIMALSAAASDLVRSPIDLYQTVQSLLGDIVTAAENPFDAYDALRTFWDYTGTDDDIPTTTPHRVQQAENRAALTSAFSTAVAAEASRAAVQADYDSQAAADTARDVLADQMDILAMTADPALYEALMDLRASVIEDLGSRSDLPGLVSLTLTDTLPALVVAHRIYGDAGRNAEIVSRNNIPHPGFIPSGKTLEVLDA